MNTLFALVLAGAINVNPFADIDVSRLNAVEKEYVVDQEAKIKSSGSKIHDEIE